MQEEPPAPEEEVGGRRQSKQQPVVGSMQRCATWPPTAMPAESTAPQVQRVTAFGWAALTHSEEVSLLPQQLQKGARPVIPLLRLLFGFS